jgi:hypothetical protein
MGEGMANDGIRIMRAVGDIEEKLCTVLSLVNMSRSIELKVKRSGQSNSQRGADARLTAKAERKQ